MDEAALDLDRGGTSNDTCLLAEMLFIIGACVFANTRTAAEHVASSDPVHRFNVGNTYCSVSIGCTHIRHTDFTAIYGDFSVPAHATVLTSTKHRAKEVRFSVGSGVVCTDDDG